MKTRLLILGAGIFQVPVIKKAKDMGCYVGTVDINEKAPGVPLADEYFKCSLWEKEKVLDIAKQFKTEGITVGTCDAAVVTAAYVAEEMGLPFYNQEVAKRATNKIDMIQRFKSYNVASPKYEVIKEGEVIRTSIPYPVITKPADRSASVGIFRVENENDLKRAVNLSMAESTSKEVLIEEYMDGPEISVELGIVGDEPIALQVTDKITNGAPHYIEIGQIQPMQFSRDMMKQVKSLAIKAAKAVGLTNCAGHAEIKITSDGPKMVEIGGRMGGHFIDSWLLEASTGYQLQEAIIRYALGEKFELGRTECSGAAGMLCILSEEGKITDISGVDKARQIPGLLDVILTCEVGQKYHSGVSNHDLIGYVIASGDTYEEVLSICKAALSCIKIIYSQE